MKRALFLTIFSVLALVFLTGTSLAQGWFLQSSGTTQLLEGVSFTDPNVGTVVGHQGTILRTTNGGVVWTSQTSGTTEHLEGVSFVSSLTGTAVGEQGTILRTTNGGGTWVSQSSGTTKKLEAVVFLDANIGTTVGDGGTILRTTNGGLTWTSQTSATPNHLHAVSFVDANIGTTVGATGRIVRTTNGGANWDIQTSGTTRDLWGVSFSDANNGTAVGEMGTILRTTNGGATWTSQTSGTTVWLRSVWFVSAMEGFTVGDGGTILHTTNGGATWASQTSGTTQHLRFVQFTDSNNGTTVGMNGIILRTTTGGVDCSSTAITLSPSTLPNGTEGVAYNQTITASGGIAPYSFAVTSGVLPPGLSLSSGGVLSGTPTTVGSFAFTITATDDNNCTGSRSYAITINCPTITVNPSTLPNGTVGTSYSQTLTATGGTIPYTFTVSSGTLPNGLTLSTSGLLSGTPTTIGTFTFTVTATDAQGCSGSRAYSLTINCPTITVNPSLLPNGTVGTSYSQTLSASGGTSPYTFAVTSGVLPAGLSLSSSGIISGTPTTVGSFTFTVTATDAQNCTGNRSYTLTIDCPTITITPSTLPNGTVGLSYSQTLTASGGTSPYTFSVTGGSLPPGLTLSSSGLLSGTPTTVGNFSFTVTATDTQNCTGSQSYTVVINCPTITVNPATLPSGTVGTAYTQTITATGGTSPYTFSVTSGAVPSGLSLSSSGVLSGTPTSVGNFSFTVTATDDQGCTGVRSYTLTINCPTITLSPSSLPNGTVGSSYNQTITASGGTAPYSFNLTSGTLPDGIGLSSSGILSGTPTETGSFTFTITATDAQGCSGSKSYSLTIDCPVITLSSLSNGTVGIPYSQTITASNGTPPYTFSVTGGTLPTGLSLSSSGVLSGTPTTEGTFTFTVTATDAQGCTGSQSYSLTMSCPTITLSGLPNGTVGTPYSETITASGGTAPYTFSQAGGTLPTGLSLSSGGVLSGTPTASGSFSFTVTVTDANGCTGSQSYTLMMNCPSITISPTSLPNGTVGIAYSQTLTASGGTSPHTFAVTGGSIPDGLTLSSSGVLSGTPTTDNTFTFTVTATDAYGCTASQSYSITIGTCPTITLSPSALPNGSVGSAYSQTITASGGTAPYTFAETAGTLPTGLTLSSGGILSGTPSEAGSFIFTVTATDNIGCTGSLTYTVTTCTTITLSSLPNGTVGSAYSQAISASGGTAPYTFTLSSGTLPTGISLSSSGVLSGTPSSSGSFTFTVEATDVNGCSGSRSYSLTMSCPTITLSPSTLPDGTVGSSYSQNILASGGTSPYSFTVTSGSIPSGLSLSSMGVLSGTPTTVGSSTFTVTATGAHGCTGSQVYKVTVDCPVIDLSPETLPNGTVGVAYSQTITASGGTSPYSFAVVAGALPDGVVLSSSGALFGTPTASGSFNFTIRATDAQGCQGDQSYTVSVGCPTISLSPSSLPDGTVGVLYSQVTVASGGTAPYSFSVTGGSLPNGLTLSPSGTLSGTPTTVGSSSCTITATDAQGCAGNKSYSITINCPTIILSPTSLPDGSVGESYSQTITASGGTSPYSFAVTLGSLPDGLTLSSTGVLSGIPTSVGGFGFTITATDNQGCTESKSYTLSIDCPPITVKPFSLPNGVAGTVYNQLITASGGTEPYTFTISSGVLPSGLSLSSSGTLSGTPSAIGDFSFTVTVTDAQGCTGSQEYTFTIDCPKINLNPSTLPNGSVDVAYTETITANGGTAPHSFNVSNGTPPPGLVLSSSGLLSGTPSTGGTYTFTVTATDALGCTGSQTYVVSISVIPEFAVTPLKIAFGDVLVGSSKQDSITVTNTGTGPLTIFSVSSTSGHFMITPNSAIVPAGSNKTFYVTFNPASMGAKSGNIIFTHNASGSPAVVAVNGTGVAPGFLILTNILFGNVLLGSSKQDSIAVMNTGTTTLTISSASSDNPEFSVTPSGAVLPPSMSVKFYITYNPTTLGEKSGNIILTHDAAGSPGVVPVSGTGIVNVTLLKFKDTDGDPSTTADQSPKRWQLALYYSSVDSTNLIAAADTQSLTVAVSQAGTYIACEVDSGLPWIRINGNGTQYDTLTINASSVSDTFINMRLNAFIVRKFEDMDGDFSTKGDRVPKNWHLEIRKDSVGGDLIASGDAGSLVAVNLGDGTYYAVEADSAEWTHIGYDFDGLPTATSTNNVAISLVNGQSVTIDFINARSIYYQTFRSFIPEDLSQKKPVKKKPAAMRFCAQFVNNTEQEMTGLQIVFRVLIRTSIVVQINDRGPFTIASSFDGRTWIFGGATTSPGDTVTICGIGNSGRAVAIQEWYWLLNGVQQAKQPKFTPPNQVPLLAMPNFANLRDDVYLQQGFGATGGMIVGILRSDSSKKYGWARIKTSKALQRSIIDRTGMHTRSGRGFDGFTSGRPFIKEQKEVPPRKHNNRLFAELVALKFGIVASAMGKSPVGFGEFIYDEGNGNPLSGLTLTQIVARVDSAMTYWKDSAYHGWSYANFDTTIAKINRAFDGSVDTLSYTTKLVFKGVLPLVEVPFLHPNLSTKPARIEPVLTDALEIPQQYVLYQNYPNPFNPTTTIEFDLPEPAFVTLKVYNLLGQEIATLLDHEEHDEGSYDIEWEALSFASGVYFYRIVAQGIADEEEGTIGQTFSTIKKMLLIK
ncbi:MAG: putative Ig domain-containing protein [Ignavibacteriae bacterium]|nr:putative Ig domain-containing protein [Ignavibacteriota bacterium]